MSCERHPNGFSIFCDDCFRSARLTLGREQASRDLQRASENMAKKKKTDAAVADTSKRRKKPGKLLIEFDSYFTAKMFGRDDDSVDNPENVRVRLIATDVEDDGLDDSDCDGHGDAIGVMSGICFAFETLSTDRLGHPCWMPVDVGDACADCFNMLFCRAMMAALRMPPYESVSS